MVRSSAEVHPASLIPSCVVQVPKREAMALTTKVEVRRVCNVIVVEGDVVVVGACGVGAVGDGAVDGGVVGGTGSCWRGGVELLASAGVAAPLQVGAKPV